MKGHTVYIAATWPRTGFSINKKVLFFVLSALLWLVENILMKLL